MNYAVIETGGKQYKVIKGETLEVENLNTDSGKEYVFDKVLLTVSDGKIKIGSPYIKDVRVYAKIIENLKGEKVYVMKYRSKVRHRRRTGFRHMFSRVKIDDIKAEGVKKESLPQKKVEKKVRSVKK